MKPLTKKILESGIVDKTTALMLEKWKMLDDGAADIVGAATREALEKFVDEIDELIEAEVPIKETRLDVSVTKPPQSFFSHIDGPWAAVEDEMGRLIVKPSLKIHIGEKIWRGGDNSEPYLIVVGIDKLYNGDEVFALQLTIQKLGE